MSRLLERGQTPSRTTEITTITIGDEYKDPVYPHTGNIESLQIFQAARAGFLAKRGITPETLANQGLFPLMTKQVASYRGQSYPGESVDIVTSLIPSRRKIVFHHEMRKGGQLVVEAICDYLLINQTGKPQLIPTHLVTQLEQPTPRA